MGTERDGRIDFFRGLALVFIFWDHIPDNILGNLTLRNVGLSDAAEVFVFLAGYSATLAYSRTLARDGSLAACLKILRRSWVLYVAHIFVMVLLMGVVFVTNAHVETRDFIQEMHLGYFVTQPEQALIDALTLRFKPSLMDPLPLYVMLLLALAAVLPILVRKPSWILGASALLYGLTITLDWHLPANPGGGWFFNPLAWQFLFFLGGAVALKAQAQSNTDRELSPSRKQSLLLAGSLVVLILGAALSLSWRWPALHDVLVPHSLGVLIYPIDKTNLAPLRLIHFLALAYCAALLLPRGGWLDMPISRHMRRIGRHSLEVFCLGAILAPLADAASTLSGDPLDVQITVGLIGVAVMAAFALLLEWSRALPRPALRTQENRTSS